MLPAPVFLVLMTIIDHACRIMVICDVFSHLQIQIWLAMAYEANRRHKDCIALYKELESTHPMISIRRQAAELRYISEAPKLKISNDEVVTIPQIGSSWYWLVIYLNNSTGNFNLCMWAYLGRRR